MSVICCHKAKVLMAALQALTDEELQHYLVHDNEQAFTALYERYIDDVRAILVKILKTTEIADDAAQEVFIKIWNGRNQLKHVRVFKAYLLVATRNHGLNSLKSLVRSETAKSRLISDFITQRNSTDEELLSKEYQQFLQRVLDTLPARSREIFTMCRTQERSYDEVSAELGISRNAVKNHMVYSMKVLRSAVENELGIPLGVLLLVFLKQ